MNFNVKDLAGYAGVSVAEMITLLTDKAPDVNWKANTPVPDALVQLFMTNVDEYKAASTMPTGALISADGDGASIAQMMINSEATQYALIEALGNIDMKDVVTTAVMHSLAQIETYESTKSKIWEGYLKSRLTASNERTNQASDAIKKQAAERQVGISNRMQTATAASTTAKEALEDANAFLTQTLASI
ncbi:MAG: hypothetical protein KME46_29825 [Brasilonema angustatum HA4187-MV1]|jgi:hypothetical protein|nr:hypothetical protein [Brasilonema angustatum HA4187-MV1]